MITDEQIALVLKTFHQHSNPNDTIAMGKALEAYESSKWVKFNEFDQTTFPKDQGRYVVSYPKAAPSHPAYTCILGWYSGNMSHGISPHWEHLHTPSYWQPLPEFKE